jgi:anaerobic magnesium-protoporphyrin IX monomethyl ester cyclase
LENRALGPIRPLKVLLYKPIVPVRHAVLPPLGLGYLARALQEEGHRVTICDPGRDRLDWAGFTRVVREGCFDLAGVQMFTPELAAVQKHLDLWRKISPETVLVVGGFHVSGDPVGTMERFPQADFGFVGEAERGLAGLARLSVDQLRDPAFLAEIPGLVWRQEGEVRVNPNPPLQDLDTLGFPAWERMPPASYPVAPHGLVCRQVPSAPLVTSRGCPFGCTFCATQAVGTRQFRQRSVGNVLAEIALLVESYGVREIHIEDDNFTLRRDYVLEFCERLHQARLGLTLALPNGVRLDTLDEEVLTAMQRAGFHSLAVGIESGNDRVLKLVEKSLSRDLIAEKIRLIKKTTSMSVTGFFMLGYPTETEEEILQSIRFAKELPLDHVTFTCCMPLPGSSLWEEYRTRRGEAIPWEDFFFYRAVEGLSELPAARLRALQRRAMREFYLRPRVLAGALGRIRSWDQVANAFGRLVELFRRS